MVMTDEEIEFALRQYATGGGRNVMNMDWAGTLDYINRLKAENATLQDENRRVLDWKRRQEDFMNKAIDRFDEELKRQKEQICKDTAKEILQRWWRDATVGRNLENQNEGTELWYIKQTAREFGVEAGE